MNARRGSLMEYHWVRDDAEEDLVGADWHQESLASQVNGLRRVGRAARNGRGMWATNSPRWPGTPMAHPGRPALM